MERRTFNPKRGGVYTHRSHSNGQYQCIRESKTEGKATLVCLRSGWTFVAHGCGFYSDGTFDWDFSTGGYFQNGRIHDG